MLTLFEAAGRNAERVLSWIRSREFGLPSQEPDYTLKEIQCIKCDQTSGMNSHLAGEALRRTSSVNTARCSLVPSRASTSFYIDGHGPIPVLKGDLIWIPEKVKDFICESAALMKPSAIRICNGSPFEAQEMVECLTKRGCVECLSAARNVYLSRTDPLDTRKFHEYSFIVGRFKKSGGMKRNPLASFPRTIARAEFDEEVADRFPNCMQGRVMYVIPCSFGPISGEHSINCVQITDSPYVVLNTRVLTRVSSSVWDSIGTDDFVRHIHSMGAPRPVIRQLRMNWPCNPSKVFIAHKLQEKEIWSYGSNFGDNSLVRESVGLCLASYLGVKQGWLAEHAAIISLTNPEGKEVFMCAAFPPGCGKTALATMNPKLPGWKVQLLSDDIAWLRWHKGQLYAMAPENGLFANYNNGEIMKLAVEKDALIVNCGSTNKKRPFWDEMKSELLPGETVMDWKSETWDERLGLHIAHPHSRVTVSTQNMPNVHPKWDEQLGVPISAYIFGTRRYDSVPLVVECNSWEIGVSLAAGLRYHEKESWEKAKEKKIVFDPFGMSSFISYSFIDYVEHWFEMGKLNAKNKVRMYHVNWYQEDGEGHAMWPGHEENIRVLEWIFERITNENNNNAERSGLGMIPKTLNLEGLSQPVNLQALLNTDAGFYLSEFNQITEYIDREMGRTSAIGRMVKEHINQLAATILFFAAAYSLLPAHSQ